MKFLIAFSVIKIQIDATRSVYSVKNLQVTKLTNKHDKTFE